MKCQVTQVFGTGDATVFCPETRRMLMVYRDDAAASQVTLLPGKELHVEVDAGRVVAVSDVMPARAPASCAARGA